MTENDEGLRAYWRPRQAAASDIAAVVGDDGPAWHWTDDAACIGTDPDVFFPERGVTLHAAREICRGCGVRAQCLDYAVRTFQEGVWGGTSEDERVQMRRSAQAAPESVLPVARSSRRRHGEGSNRQGVAA